MELVKKTKQNAEKQKMESDFLLIISVLLVHNVPFPLAIVIYSTHSVSVFILVVLAGNTLRIALKCSGYLED